MAAPPVRPLPPGKPAQVTEHTLDRHLSPPVAHAVSALADERDALLDRVERLEQAIWEACDSFRSLGCSSDADDLENAVRASANEGEQRNG